MGTCANGGCQRMVDNRSIRPEGDLGKLIYQTRMSCFTCGRASEWEPYFNDVERLQAIWDTLVATQ